ncbi:11507_t:CDS:2 [Dentiscutata heterogama]|uniref:11507_t:CDS:1 n=1 Tax=Dentiscutata heterogama TaxID=1316150 RepID=A0ACA9KAU8_9GLOM|nr:11507_t:CDS:2 [Dentiscutata heterogama]
MEKICEIVPSQKGINKINICDYLLKFNDHNHAPQASSAEVARSIAFIRDRVYKTNDQLAQIIQKPSLISQRKSILILSHNAFLDDIDIPDSLSSTSSREDFLVKDSVIEDERILLFTTKANIQHLSRSSYWMMDSTFKTILTIFRQLYTIHAPIKVGKDSRVLPLVYALMTKKSKELYRALFQDLIKFAKENNILLRPTIILTNFELAAINASRIEFSNINNKVSLRTNILTVPAAFDALKKDIPTNA